MKKHKSTGNHGFCTPILVCVHLGRKKPILWLINWQNIVLHHSCDLPTVAKDSRALEHAIIPRFDCTFGRDIEAAREEMDIQMKERKNERI